MSRRTVMQALATGAAFAVAAAATGATASSVGATASSKVPSAKQPTEINISKDLKHRYGEPEIAVNPKNPNNIAYAVLVMGQTYACQKAKRPECREATSAFGPQPAGLLNDVPGFSRVRVYVSFDAGKSWKQSKHVPAHPPGKNDLVERGDPLITAGPDGTFYLAWDDIHFADLPKTIIRDAGVAVSTSKDGGLTWSSPVLTGTPVDRPFFAADLSTGAIYEASTSQLGANSEGDPSLPPSPIGGPGGDRWLVSSRDGVHWTDPKAFGGVPSFPPGTFVTAAHGLFATAFSPTDPSLCGGTKGCTVFQTTSDSGATWSRHPLPVPPGSSGAPLIAGDPKASGHFTVAVLNGGGTQFLVYQTKDSGTTWTGPTMITDDASKTHFHPWLAYSSTGVVGLMWQANVKSSSGPTAGALPAAIPPSVLESLPEQVQEAIAAGAPVPESMLASLPEQVREAIAAQAAALSPYDVWAAISKDGGATFSAPLRVSRANSPAPQTFLPFGVGDDFSFLAMSGKYAFVGWADYRPGDRQAFFRAIPLQAFKTN
jgi:hypothetical protein